MRHVSAVVFDARSSAPLLRLSVSAADGEEGGPAQAILDQSRWYAAVEIRVAGQMIAAAARVGAGR